MAIPKFSQAKEFQSTPSPSLEGEASRVTDRPTLETVATLYREGGWPAEVEGDAFTAPFSAPSAGPPKASEFAVQQSVEAAENVRPTGLKFSSTVLPAIGSTIKTLPSSASVSKDRRIAPAGSPISCRQSKKQIKSY